ncbi:MAG: tetratricopeptide repeat protein [Chlorobiaceae bacterium]
MIRLPILLYLITVTFFWSDMFREYRLKLKAYYLYEKHDYSKAETIFSQLLRIVPEGKESASIRFNLACAVYMQGKYSNAAKMFTSKAMHKTEEYTSVKKSRFNKGNSLAMTAIETSEKKQKTELFRNSLAYFKLILLENPDDGDTKINYEIVQRYLQELEHPQPQSSSKSKKNSDTRHNSVVDINVAARLLEQAQQNESLLMRRIPRRGTTATPKSENKDW